MSHKHRGICKCGRSCCIKGGRCWRCFYSDGGVSNKKEDALDKFEIAENGCWNWLGYITKKGWRGYGRFQYNNIHIMAHRVIWELLVGEFPDGLYPDHLCRNRRCVNPAHIEPVTARENVIRGNTIIARNISRTHCPRGHEYDEANTYRDKKGGRYCRKCSNIRSKLKNKGRMISRGLL